MLTTTPTAEGSFPDGTSLFNIAFINDFSPPCGYIVFSGITSIFVPWQAFLIASIASGLLSSIPITALSTFNICFIIFIPSITFEGSSIITLLSEFKYGSHSAPFSNNTSIFTSAGGFNFTCVGKAAPPRPTIPLDLITFNNSSLVEFFHSGSFSRVVHSSCSSFSITIVCTFPINGNGKFSIFFTVPLTDACTGTDKKASESAIICPFKTLSPISTQGVKGTPMC